MSGMGVLDDKYAFVREVSEKPQKECEDGCIYKRDSSPGDEYCFMNKDYYRMGSM